MTQISCCNPTSDIHLINILFSFSFFFKVSFKLWHGTCLIQTNTIYFCVFQFACLCTISTIQLICWSDFWVPINVYLQIKSIWCVARQIYQLSICSMFINLFFFNSIDLQWLGLRILFDFYFSLFKWR